MPPLPAPASDLSPALRPEDALRLAGDPSTEDWPTDALQVVNRLLTGAEGEATKIRAEAEAHATELRAEASGRGHQAS